MKFIFTFLATLLLAGAYAQQAKYSHVKVYGNESELRNLAAVGVAMDEGEQKRGHWVIADFSAAELKIIQQRGLKHEVLEDDLAQFYRDRNSASRLPSAAETQATGDCISKTMSNQREFQYIEAKECLHLPVIEIGDVKSFTRFANSNNIEFIFRITRNDVVEFFFTLSQVLYKLKECEYIETPSKTQADEFLIAAAKKEKSLIVTNDTFSDWKAKDKWVKDKFDTIRVPFTISKSDAVILKGMDKFMENLVSE